LGEQSGSDILANGGFWTSFFFIRNKIFVTKKAAELNIFVKMQPLISY